MLKYLLLGRIGSGKNSFAKQLEKDGFKIAKSYTTRLQRNKNDTLHTFVDESVINDDLDIILKTTHRDAVYCYTRQMILDNDIINIDPENIDNICKLFPDITFRFLYIMASNELRLTNAVKDAEDKITAETDFVDLCADENDAFIKFEDSTLKGNFNSEVKNLITGHLISNDFTETSDIYKWSDDLKDSIRSYNRMVIISKELADAGCVEYDENNHDNVMVAVKNPDDNIVFESTAITIFAEHAFHSQEGLSLLMSAWLKLKNNSFAEDELLWLNE